MKVQASKTYTVRGIPAEVNAALRRKAAQRKLSLNQVVLEELSQAAVGPCKISNLSAFVGKWKEDPAFDEAIALQRKIDWEKWK